MEQACEVSRRSCLVPFGTSLSAAEPKGGPFGEARGPEPPAMQLAAAKPGYGQDPSSCYIPLRRLQDLASMINAEYLGGAADGAEALPDPGSPGPRLPAAQDPAAEVPRGARAFPLLLRDGGEEALEEEEEGAETPEEEEEDEDDDDDDYDDDDYEEEEEEDDDEEEEAATEPGPRSRGRSAPQRGPDSRLQPAESVPDGGPGEQPESSAALQLVSTVGARAGGPWPLPFCGAAGPGRAGRAASLAPAPRRMGAILPSEGSPPGPARAVTALTAHLCPGAAARAPPTAFSPVRNKRHHPSAQRLAAEFGGVFSPLEGVFLSAVQMRRAGGSVPISCRSG